MCNGGCVSGVSTAGWCVCVCNGGYVSVCLQLGGMFVCVMVAV